MFVLFDECWRPDPQLGPQPEPIPGQHNSQWVRCPAQAWLMDTSKWPLLKHYEPLAQTMQQVAELKQFKRPLICTEYMARTAGSTFHTHTVFFHKEKIGAINWGLVAGKTQTYFPWGSPVNATTPLVWFHDIFNASGSPYSPYEVQFFKDLQGTASK
ncbi:unnamed protein product, partial [Rotaria sp. Silwood1]